MPNKFHTDWMVHIRHTKLLDQSFFHLWNSGSAALWVVVHSVFFETHHRHSSLCITINRSVNSWKLTEVSPQVESDSSCHRCVCFTGCSTFNSVWMQHCDTACCTANGCCVVHFKCKMSCWGKKSESWLNLCEEKYLYFSPFRVKTRCHPVHLPWTSCKWP